MNRIITGLLAAVCLVGSADAQQIGVQSMPQAIQTICQKGASASVTGTLTETNLAVCVVPSMGPNDSLRVSALYSYTNSANSKTLRIRFSTSSGDISGGASVMAVASTTTAAQYTQTLIHAANSTSSQITQSTGTIQTSAAAPVSSNFDTTTTTYLNFNGQLSNTGETITLLAYNVELMKGN